MAIKKRGLLIGIIVALARGIGAEEISSVEKKENLSGPPLVVTPASIGGGTGKAGVSASSVTSKRDYVKTFIQFRSLFLRSEYQERFQLGTMELTVGYFSVEIPQYLVLIQETPKRLFFSLQELIEGVKGSVQLRNGQKVYLFDPTSALTINEEKKEIIIFANNKTQTLTLNESNCIPFNGDYFLSEEILDIFFNIHSSFSDLKVHMSPNFKGSAEVKVTNDLRHKSLLESEKKIDQKKLTYQTQPELFNWGRGSFYYTLMNSANSNLNVNYYAPMLWGTGIFQARAGSYPLINSAYVTYPLGENNVVNIGDNFYVPLMTYTSYSGSLSGVYVGKSNSATSSYGTMTFSGIAPQNQLVELFRNHQLVAFQYATESGYEFDNIPIVGGRDKFIIRSYQEDGTYIDVEQPIYSNAGFLKKGESNYGGSVGKQLTMDTSKLLHSIESGYGWSSDLTTVLSQTQGVDDQSVAGEVLYKNTFYVPNYLNTQWTTFNDDTHRFSYNHYFLFSDTIQANLSYINSTNSQTNTANGILYFQQEDTSYSLEVTGSYYNQKKTRETLNVAKRIAQGVNVTIGGGVEQNSAGHQYQLTPSFMYAPLNNLIFMGNFNYMWQASFNISQSLSAIYTTDGYSVTASLMCDIFNQWSQSINVNLPFGLGPFTTFSGSYNSSHQGVLNMGRSFMVSQPLDNVTGSNSDGWIYGRVYTEDGTPYHGGTLLVGGKSYKVSSSGEFFISDMVSNKVVEVDLRGLSESRYGAAEPIVYIKVGPAQALKMNIQLIKVRNIFGTLIAPYEVLTQCHVFLEDESGKRIEGDIDSQGAYSFNKVTGEEYQLIIMFPPSLKDQYDEIRKSISFTKKRDWILKVPPITLTPKKN